jgi:hypothetical protein
MTDRSVPNVFVQRADGAGEPREVTRSENQQSPTSWSKKGILVYDEVRPETHRDVFALDMTIENPTPIPVLESAAWERDAQFSPDGRWLAYVSDDLGTREVFVQPYPGPGGRWQISDGSGRRPRWSSNGKEIYYWSDRSLMARPVTTGGTALALGSPRKILEYRQAGLQENDYDVGPDGSLILLERAESDGQPTQTVLILDWVSTLKDQFDATR